MPTKTAQREKTSPVQAQRRQFVVRLLGLAGFLLFWIAAIGVRLISLQIVRYGEFTQRASRQQQRTVDVSPSRGVIYDRNGHALAMSVAVDSVFAVPSEVPDPANAARLIARITDEDPKEILTRLESSRSFAWIARKLETDEADRIRALNLKGIYFEKETKRFYPKRELAAQVLGFVGMDDEGLGGIERSFDSRLKGKPGKMLVSVDARQRSLGRFERQPEPGDNVVLTIDQTIQYIAERELERTIAETHAEAGTVVIQNPYTGEILALASRPTFNPNEFHKYEQRSLKDRAISDVFEPGSTFKIITLSAALEEKVTTPDEVIDCQNGAITIFGHTIHDHERLGLLTTSQIMQKSSDVGAIKLGLRLGDDRFYKYIRGFGMGQPTGIELPGETRGMAKSPQRWSKVSIGAISMGQEIGVSAVQLVSMVSAIANDGVYTPARVVAGVVPPRQGLQTIEFAKPEQHRVISPLTAAEMKRILEDTVLFGTGKYAILDGYTSAGKTGTAQKIDPATGTYSKTKYVASFAGFAPVNHPAITVAVMLDSPEGRHQGGQVSAPLFGRVAQQVLAYMNVSHDTEIRSPRREQLRASAKDSDLDDAASERLGDDFDMAELKPAEPVQPAVQPVKSTGKAVLVPAVYNDMKLARQPPQPAAPEPKATAAVITKTPVGGNGTIIIDTGGGTVAPSLIGKTVRAALEETQRLGLEMDVIGSGVAVQQSPAPGERIPAGGRMVVKFSR